MSILSKEGDCIIDRNFAIALNKVKKALANGEDRLVYDMLVSMVSELKPYIDREYSSDRQGD